MARAIKVKVKKLTPLAKMPSKTHELDACWDITAIGVEYDPEKDNYVYSTGLAFQTDSFSVIRAYPRSSNCKTEYYLTNHVGTIDPCTYTGEVKAIFKHRDSLDVRLFRLAMDIYDDLPWYKKLKKGKLKEIKESLKQEFLKDPLKWAPYEVGDRVFQIDIQDVNPVEYKSVAKLKDTVRGPHGFGSTNKGKKKSVVINEETKE